ncbi:FxSxx-COOH system tetratricopeptide repeat protein [Actinoplanes sp. CA-030573]|uniref:FxSxx-COOH system tetratricopeptide repeat protein n=1 Tax=Actinoplanes sp. CA-030573 TaxID=3239898 RepID=UPI003D92F16A
MAVAEEPTARLAQAIRDLHRDAGKPGLRRISSAIRERDDLKDTVSHQAVSDILRGGSLPRWLKLECVVRQLAAWSVNRPEPDAEVRRFHAMWLAAADGKTSVATMGDAPAAEGVPAVDSPPAGPSGVAGGVLNVPARNSAFVGRRETLATMRRLLDGVPRRPLVIRGIGGVGKTQLAVEFAHRHAARYDVVWWVPAAGPAQARAALASLAERLDLPRGRDPYQTALTAVDALGESALRWLLVFDNADDPAAIRMMLPPGGDVIVTSRVHGWSSMGHVLDLEVFSRPESVELLCRRGAGISPADADPLAERLGDLPLALGQVAAVQSATGMPVQEYLRLFAEHLNDLLGPQPHDAHATSVAAFVMVAIQALRERSPAAAQLFELFAFLGSEPVPVTLFRLGQQADIDPPLGRALYQYDFIERVVNPLVRYGVARLEPAGQRIQVHRLIRSVLREQIGPERAEKVRRTTHRLLGAANPGDPDDPRTWSLHAAIGPNLIASEALRSDDLSVRQAIVDQIRYLERRGEYEESWQLGELAVSEWGRPPGTGGATAADDLTFRAIRDTANALRALGRYEDARTMTRVAFDRLRDDPQYGEDHPLTLDFAGALGIYLRITGAYREALEIDRAVVGRRDRPGTDEAAKLRAMGNLAVSLRMNGMFAEAYTVDLQTRDGYTRRLGADHPRTLLATANLTKDLYGLGRFRESLNLVESILPVQVRLHGEGHENVLWSSRMRVLGLRQAGRDGEAVSLAVLNRDAVDRRFGPSHESTLLSMITLANTLWRAGDLDEARTLADETAYRCRTALGRRHPMALAAAVNTAAINRLAGARDDVYLSDQLTVRELTQVVGESHPYTLAASNGLAIDLMLRHGSGVALDISRSVVERAYVALGRDHPYTLAYEANLGTFLTAAGDSAQGHALHAEALAGLAAQGVAVSGVLLECEIEPPES